MRVSDAQNTNWTFFSNHALVLLALVENPHARVRDLAERVGITERAVHSIVTDLEVEGALTRFRTGRRNRYEIHSRAPLRHPVGAHRTVGDLVALIQGQSTTS